jgi:predicted GNAT family N-acyltransferase
MSIACIDFTSEFYLKSQKLRNQVLREPLGQNLFDEDLNDEINQIHFVALEKEVRGQGYGKLLVSSLELFASEHGMKSIILHARHNAIGFYEKLGYQITSDVFQEVGIDHVVMEKNIGVLEL